MAKHCCLKFKHLNTFFLWLTTILWVNCSFAQSFVDFSSLLDHQPDHIVGSTSSIPTVFEEGYFEYLQARFANQKLDEVLFLERPAISSQRLTVDDIRRMGKTVKDISQNVPGIHQRIKMPFAFQAFRFDQKSEYIKQSDIDYFYQLYPKIIALRNQYGGSFNEERVRLAFSEWLQDKGSIQKTSTLADILLLSVIPEKAYSNYSSMPSAVILLHWNHMVKQAINLGNKLKLPNKILDSLLQYSSLSNFKPKDILKGLVAMPMTPEEAVFKGVGPGECVRTSLFRYVDSFFQSARVIKILKDGIEVGYVTIYQTKTDGGQKVWLIETIQGPILSLVKNKTALIRNLIGTMQSLSAQSDALLAVPAKSMNTFNFKEISSSIIGMSEYVSGISTKVDYEDKSNMEQLNRLALSSHSSIDQSILELSGYNKSSVVNAMTINNGEVKILAPHSDLDYASLDKYLSLFINSKGRKGAPVLVESQNSLVRKAAMLKAIGSDFNTKVNILNIYERLKKEGDLASSAVVQEFLYEYLPRELWDKSFFEKFKYLEHRVNNVPQADEVATALKAEILMSASSWDEFIAVTQLGDRGSTFPSLLLQALNYFAKFNQMQNWLEVYSEMLRLTKTPSEDFLLSRIIVDKIQTSENFLNFSNIASGKAGSMKWDDSRARSAFLAEESRRFDKFPSAEQRFLFFDQLLKVLQEQADLQVRSDLADTFTSIEELKKLSEIGHHGNSWFSEKGGKVYQKIVLETFNRITKNMTIDEVQKHVDVFPKIIRNFEAESRFEFCRVLAAKYRTTTQLSTILRSFGIGNELVFRPDFFSNINSDLRLSYLRSEPNSILDFVSKLRIGTPEAIFASGGTKLLAESKKAGLLGRLKILWKMRSFKNILHPDDSTSLSKVLDSLSGHPEFLEKIITSLSKRGVTIHLDEEIPEHKELIEKIGSISSQLSSEKVSVLRNIFGKYVRNLSLRTQIMPRQTHQAIGLKCSELFYGK